MIAKPPDLLPGTLATKREKAAYAAGVDAGRRIEDLARSAGVGSSPASQKGPVVSPGVRALICFLLLAVAGASGFTAGMFGSWPAAALGTLVVGLSAATVSGLLAQSGRREGIVK